MYQIVVKKNTRGRELFSPLRARMESDHVSKGPELIAYFSFI